MLAQFLLYK